MPRDHVGPLQSWWSTNPATQPVGTSNIYIGHNFTVDVPGRIFGFRAYLDIGTTSAYWAILWDDQSVTPLCYKLFYATVVPAAAGWQSAYMWRSPIRILADHTYGYFIGFPGGKYGRTANALVSNVTHGHITFQHGLTSTAFDPVNGAKTATTYAYGADIFFLPD